MWCALGLPFLLLLFSSPLSPWLSRYLRIGRWAGGVERTAKYLSPRHHNNASQMLTSRRLQTPGHVIWDSTRGTCDNSPPVLPARISPWGNDTAGNWASRDLPEPSFPSIPPPRDSSLHRLSHTPRARHSQISCPVQLAQSYPPALGCLSCASDPKPSNPFCAGTSTPFQHPYQRPYATRDRTLSTGLSSWKILTGPLKLGGHQAKIDPIPTASSRYALLPRGIHQQAIPRERGQANAKDKLLFA